MSAANLLPDSALQSAPDVGDADCEQALPTQPWHAPPELFDALGTFEFESEFEQEPEAGGELASFDFHDTIPAPPWLDEPADALEIPVFPAR